MADEKKLPEGMEQVVNQLRQVSSQKDCLKKAYDILSSRYCGQRIKTYTRLFDLFIYDVPQLWQKQDFLHCTHINYLFKVLLVKSEWFEG